MSLFSNGHFFIVKQNTTVRIEEDKFYALHVMIENSETQVSDSMLTLFPAPGINNKYPAKNVYLMAWNKQAEDELSMLNSGNRNGKDMYKVAYIFPKK